MSRRFAEPLLPTTAYNLVGQVGWLVEAARRGALFHLWDRPFARP